MSTIEELDPIDLVSWDRPLKRLRAEGVCLRTAIMPSPKRPLRTVVTLLFLLTWMVLVLGPAFGHTDPVRYELLVGITAIVFLILGRMWDLEVQRVLSNGLTISTGSSDDENGGD